MAKNPLSEYRNNFLPISNIHGVDTDSGVFTPHADWKNDKLTERRQIIDDIKADVKSVIDIEPIEIFVENGIIHVLDGFHRLTAVLELYKESNGTDTWERIRVNRFVGDKEAAHFQAFRKNLDDSRSPLNEREKYVAIRRFLDKGYTPEQIVAKIGKTTEAIRWVNKIVDIQNGTGEIEDAILNDQISIDTAVAIARKGMLQEQPEMVKDAIQARVEGKTDREARQAAGVAKNHKTMVTYAELQEELFSFYEPKWAVEPMDDENLEGQLTTFIFVLGWGNLPRAEAYSKLNELYYTWRIEEDARIKRQQAKNNKKDKELVTV